MKRYHWEPHKIVKVPTWPFNTKFWYWVRGVTRSNWRKVCTRCRMTGQAHLTREAGVCRRFTSARHKITTL
jgi:hypothetical protein